MTPSNSILTNKITEDKIRVLFKLLKNHPIHHIWRLYKEETGIEIVTDEVQEIYTSWAANKSNSFTFQLSAAKKADCWEKVEKRIQKKVSEEIAEFIYHHWKLHQKRTEDKK